MLILNNFDFIGIGHQFFQDFESGLGISRRRYMLWHFGNEQYPIVRHFFAFAYYYIIQLPDLLTVCSIGQCGLEAVKRRCGEQDLSLGRDLRRSRPNPNVQSKCRHGTEAQRQRSFTHRTAFSDRRARQRGQKCNSLRCRQSQLRGGRRDNPSTTALAAYALGKRVQRHQEQRPAKWTFPTLSFLQRSLTPFETNCRSCMVY